MQAGRVGQADRGAGQCVAGNDIDRCCSVGQFRQFERQDDRLACDSDAAGRHEASHLVDVGDQDLGQQAGRLARDKIDVEADEDLADVDFLALAYLRRETFALEHYGIDADMQQHLDPLPGGDGEGVVGLVQLSHCTGHRGEQVATGAKPGVELVVLPPMPYLGDLIEDFEGSAIAFGAQDVSSNEKGAYTGEVSAAMLVDVGARYGLVGHSERRQYHAESSELVARKFLAARNAGLTPILCVGETLEQREAGQTLSLIHI